MGKIISRKTALGTIYERYGDDNKLIQEGGALGFKKEYEGKTFFIIHDINGQLLDEANYYLNILLDEKDYKNRELAFSSLKLFYSFVEIFNITDFKENLTKQEVNQLMWFLEGGQTGGLNNDLLLKVNRTNMTINLYLFVIRDFYKTAFGVNDGYLFKKASRGKISGGGFLGHTKKRFLESFAVNKRLPESILVPKYIKPYEYEKIMNLLGEDVKNLRDKIIIKLMYKRGLRIGEILGLTFEDVEPLLNGFYKLVIRNRVSDHPYQSAKSVIKVNSFTDYDTKSYKNLGLGFQYVIIDEETKLLIDDYIDESRDAFLLSKSKIKSNNLTKYSFADTVNNTSRLYGDNQYIFLSHQHYKPLTQTGWNYVLKKVFIKLDIPIDKDSKSTNLSHRFRHGYAMSRVNEGDDIHQLAKALRHRDISSCYRYYNPDEEDQVDLLIKNKKMQEQRYEKK